MCAFIDLILASLDEDVDGAGIAARGYLSRCHVDRLVSAAIDEPPIAFRRRLLLERAARELRGTRDSIVRVALGAGYRAVEDFTRAFTRAFRTTPARYCKNAGCFRLPARDHIDFHLPGGIGIPAHETWRIQVDFVDRITGHDIWIAQRLLDRAVELPPARLDEPALADTPQLVGEAPVTRRALLDTMVTHKEMRSASLKGEAPP